MWRSLKHILVVYFVYALWSEKYDKIYVGSSKNPDRRLMEHNSGKSNFTRKYKPWARFYLEEVENRTEALKKEIL